MPKNEAPPNEPIAEMLQRLNANTAFGSPVKEGEVTVIPAASVSFAIAYGHQVGRGDVGPLVIQVQRTNFGGGNYGKRSAPKDATETSQAGGPPEGQATGGGGRGRVVPRGYIRIGPEGVVFEPLVDVTRLGMAGIGLTAWMVFWITRTIRAAIKARSQRAAALSEG